MIKSMTYKIGPVEKCGELGLTTDKKLEIQKQGPIKNGMVNDAYNSHSDSDSIVKDYEENDRIDEIVVIPTRDNSEDEEEDKQRLSRSETASSNESGFGTVDDELENEIREPRKNPPALTYQQRLSETKKEDVSCNSQHHSDGLNKYPAQSIKLPSLQGPRQIIYELNSKSQKRTEDNATLTLHDTSSVTSSSSSDTGPNYGCGSHLTQCVPGCRCGYPAWLSVFCCCCPVLGCISLYLTNRSKTLKLNQKHALAEKYSSCAEKLNIASLIFGVILYAIAVFLVTLVIFMHWRHQNRF